MSLKRRINILFQNTIFRYLFGIAAVASVFALRMWLIPLTGPDAVSYTHLTLPTIYSV